ncbi:hypothetical protein M8J77_001626 [Diaphorina citri]|nr:hypothetical protein M8J77_001626 [Diaphorina citri]
MYNVRYTYCYESCLHKCNTVLHLCWLTGFFLYLLMRWKIESISAEFTKLVTFSAICFVCQFLCSFSKVYGIPTKPSPESTWE